MELPLEIKAGLYNAAQCRALASKLARWAHQLTVKAAVLEARSGQKSPPRPKFLNRRQAALN